jgi:hypothetical protein
MLAEADFGAMRDALARTPRLRVLLLRMAGAVGAEAGS